MKNDPLVMPGRQPPCLPEYVLTFHAGCSSHEIDDAIVEEEKGRLETTDDEVLVVPRVGDHGRAVDVSRQIFERPV